MEIEFDPEKSARNVELRGLPFDLVADFDFDSALVAHDTREDYGEDRFIALGPIGDRLHVVAYTMRGDKLRVISFRKANAREVERYEQAQS
ncbi:MAG: BrnT family toxin [Phenylobacterium sp.]